MIKTSAVRPRSLYLRWPFPDLSLAKDRPWVVPDHFYRESAPRLISSNAIQDTFEQPPLPAFSRMQSSLEYNLCCSVRDCKLDDQTIGVSLTSSEIRPFQFTQDLAQHPPPPPSLRWFTEYIRSEHMPRGKKHGWSSGTLLRDRTASGCSFLTNAKKKTKTKTAHDKNNIHDS